MLKRWLFITSVILLLVFSNPFLFNQFAKHWDIRPVPLKDSGSYSCAIVLGGFSSVNDNGNGIFNTSADRFIQGLKLIATGKVSHILITGGNGHLLANKFRESDWVKTQLLQLKIPDSCILIENKSRNTLENAAFSKPILQKNHLRPPYILVTSAFHMRRSLNIFKKDNIDVIPYPCNYMAEGGNTLVADFIPDAGVFNGWNIYIKELIGTIVNYFK
ncbi:MAG: YdcF family protein [Mucilaginibacter sp.]